MSYLKKSEVLASVKTRIQHIDGADYPIYEAYLGVDPYTHKPVRKAAKSKEKLRKVVDEFYRRIAAGGDTANLLTAYQTMDARNALDLLAAAKNTLSLTECVRRFLANAETAFNCTVTVGNAYREYLAAQQGKSEGHIKSVTNRVGTWAELFGGDKLLSEVTQKAVEDDLLHRFYDANNEATKTTYNGNLGYLKTFFQWCVDKEYLDKNPVAKLKAMSIGWRDPEYMKPDAVEKLFRVLERRGGPDLADAILSFFCGMRQAEIERVRLGDSAVVIDLDERYIRVIKCKGALHGVKPRAFTIPDTAYAWMRSFNFLTAARTDNPHSRNHLVAAAKEAGVEIPANAGRHTFCTMFAAAFHDQAALSAIVGNTEQMRSKHYDGVTNEREGKAYFAILPSADTTSTATPCTGR